MVHLGLSELWTYWISLMDYSSHFTIQNNNNFWLWNIKSAHIRCFHPRLFRFMKQTDSFNTDKYSFIRLFTLIRFSSVRELETIECFVLCIDFDSIRQTTLSLLSISIPVVLMGIELMLCTMYLVDTHTHKHIRFHLSQFRHQLQLAIKL